MRMCQHMFQSRKEGLVLNLFFNVFQVKNLFRFLGVDEIIALKEPKKLLLRSIFPMRSDRK
jgi:hypothetical protein